MRRCPLAERLIVIVIVSENEGIVDKSGTVTCLTVNLPVGNEYLTTERLDKGKEAHRRDGHSPHNKSGPVESFFFFLTPHLPYTNRLEECNYPASSLQWKLKRNYPVKKIKRNKL